MQVVAQYDFLFFVVLVVTDIEYAMHGNVWSNLFDVAAAFVGLAVQ